MRFRHACHAMLLVTLALCVLSPRASAEQAGQRPPSDRRQFVACPVVRDTSTVPCWLAEHDGELYFLGSQGSSASAFYPPQLGHEALVEGTVAAGPRVCGGIPLDPVRVSVLPELQPACNTVLPAEGAFVAPRSPNAPIPKFPDTTRAFDVPYDFDSDYLTLHTTRLVIEAARIAKAANVPRVEVRARRGATLLSDGRTLTERPGLSEQRARKMAENLVGLGLPADRVHASWDAQPDAPDGLTDPDRRRVTITLGRTSSSADCDRPCLLELAGQYMKALAAGTPSAAPFASNATITENGVRIQPGDGLWQRKAVETTRRDVFADPESGQVAVWSVLEDGGAPALLSTRLKVRDRRITEVESVVARKGSHALFEPAAFAAQASGFDGELEPARRVARSRLVAIADGYFEGLAKHDSQLVQSAVACNRFENGVQMTNRGGTVTPRACATAVDRLTHIRAVPDRRYDIVDEVRGVVFSMVLFDIPADAAATPPREGAADAQMAQRGERGRMLLLSEVFKIADGEIQRIETVMHNLPYGASSGWPR